MTDNIEGCHLQPQPTRVALKAAEGCAQDAINCSRALSVASQNRFKTRDPFGGVLSSHAKRRTRRRQSSRAVPSSALLPSATEQGGASPANARGREMKGCHWDGATHGCFFSFMWARHHKMPRDLDIRQRGERARGPTRALP